MNNAEIETKMYEMAVAFLQKRFPTGWGGVGIVHTAQGSFFTSVALECANASALLCIETGAMCEAQKYNERVTHCLCVVREDENAPFTVLSPCGICQERLRYWGEDVQVGVTTGGDELLFVELKELQPYHWSNAYPAEELDRYVETDESLHS